MSANKVGRFKVASLCVLASCVSHRQSRSGADVLMHGGVLFTADGDRCHTWDVVPIPGGGGRIIERGQRDPSGKQSYDYFFTDDGLFVVDGPHFSPPVEEIELEELAVEGGYWASDPERPSAGARSWTTGPCAAGEGGQ